jgi:hypothetical protein
VGNLSAARELFASDQERHRRSGWCNTSSPIAPRLIALISDHPTTHPRRVLLARWAPKPAHAFRLDRQDPSVALKDLSVPSHPPLYLHLLTETPYPTPPTKGPACQCRALVRFHLIHTFLSLPQLVNHHLVPVLPPTRPHPVFIFQPLARNRTKPNKPLPPDST